MPSKGSDRRAVEWRIALFSVTFSFSHIIEMERNLIEDDENKMKEELVEEEIIWNRFFMRDQTLKSEFLS